MTETECTTDISRYSDKMLISLIRQGSDKAFNALIFRYTGTVSFLSKNYFSPSLTAEDWFQEGMIGFLNAVRTYSQNGGASFSTYATVCIKNRLNSALKKVMNPKDINTTESVDFHGNILINVDSPENNYIENENYQLLADAFRFLSVTEQSVIGYYLAGFSYNEISEKLGINEKSVDNALCRAKSKLKKILNE